MSIETVEKVYEELARAVDEVGEKNSPLFLAEVCLTLANELDDPETAIRIVRDCIPQNAGAAGK